MGVGVWEIEGCESAGDRGVRECWRWVGECWR